ncbi:lipoyl synthase [Burkholderia multivorans]|jgi:lipoic acid synthetase|uniref:Lipoyl synthase n=2 Tax=Burkholderia multivorans TaxID=87883 RepID=A0A1W0ZWF1_9BURK|nr:lipoyl synthase [Burkholderia multivorans]AIO76363.1 lipoyl synthase [Burkholderia multivorans]AOK67693.1 lipoyl synthase [Burkholderia multivorans]AYY97422.1 lipoyl synthase [Burkholderia multivorans]EED97570.1 lipoyl synthase [Burkholderia multivorans CGD1]KGB97482.1 lipoyl synthase [Burkholderia multivorans]
MAAALERPSLTALGQPGARSRDKLARIPVRVEPADGAALPKPPWLRARPMMSAAVADMAAVLRAHRLHSVCEEAMCPNIGECFAQRTATFMIMGGLCTRRCPFCDVAHGRPEPLDPDEPARLAEAVAALALRYVVITSVDRDDLRDGGAAHFAACIAAVRASVPGIGVEVLVPDFRGRIDRALDALSQAWPDVFNHNIETVPSLYRAARPGADYRGSLDLLARAKGARPALVTKSGLMLGLGEGDDEVRATMRDLRAHGVDVLTLGQYLAPSAHHLPVRRYVSPEAFAAWRDEGLALGFAEVVAGPLVRSSYHAADVLVPA